ncbi:hypothetical protein C8J57DRAFT_1255638 [Mycena rebaudengoi]|nr:hypothetical protein C8J57DRAFT_1255638 [Mycena rebaudengoi]
MSIGFLPVYRLFRYWAQCVLLGDSSFWSTLYIDPWTPLQRVHIWMERSRQRDICVYLSVARGGPGGALVPNAPYSPPLFVDAVFDALFPYFSRLEGCGSHRSAGKPVVQSSLIPFLFSILLTGFSDLPDPRQSCNCRPGWPPSGSSYCIAADFEADLKRTLKWTCATSDPSSCHIFGHVCCKLCRRHLDKPSCCHQQPSYIYIEAMTSSGWRWNYRAKRHPQVLSPTVRWKLVEENAGYIAVHAHGSSRARYFGHPELVHDRLTTALDIVTKESLKSELGEGLNMNTIRYRYDTGLRTEYDMDMNTIRHFAYHIRIWPALYRLSAMDASALRSMHLHLFPDYVPSYQWGDDTAAGITTPFMSADRAPRLRCLTLQRCLFSSVAGYGFCRDLVELHLQDIWDPIDVRQSELYMVLNCVPRLVRLHLRFVDCVTFNAIDVNPPVLAHLLHLEFAPASVGSCRFIGRIAMPILETLDLLIQPSQHLVPVIALCAPAFQTVVSAALNLRQVSSAEFSALLCSDIGHGTHGQFCGLSLIVANCATQDDGLEFAAALLGSDIRLRVRNRLKTSILQLDDEKSPTPELM